jgi:drug/metabolite transporter (DMT)-like permease
VTYFEFPLVFSGTEWRVAVPLFGEPLGPFIALGGGMVLAGVVLGQRERTA